MACLARSLSASSLRLVRVPVHSRGDGALVASTGLTKRRTLELYPVRSTVADPLCTVPHHGGPKRTGERSVERRERGRGGPGPPRRKRPRGVLPAGHRGARGLPTGRGTALIRAGDRGGPRRRPPVRALAERLGVSPSPVRASGQEASSAPGRRQDPGGSSGLKGCTGVVGGSGVTPEVPPPAMR